jgi:ornithine--oxo-acid transaminase
MGFDIKSLIRSRQGENYALHHQYVNRTLVKVQQMIGFDKVYDRAQGAYLYDRNGNAFLDFLSGYSAFNIGRNHPVVNQAIRDVLDLDLPNMVQMDCSLLSGLLAEKLIEIAPPHLNAVFFTNSGTESVEGALKFARAATGRSRVLSLDSSFHGLSYGSLSAMGTPAFTERFGPYLPGFQRVRMNDLAALESELGKGDVAAFLVETVQGKGVHSPRSEYLEAAQKLCRRFGTLFICDEVQTGLGRTGKWFGFQHWRLEPDIVTLAKSLSGGYVPCGAILTRRDIYQAMFDRLDRCVVHSTTFGRNNLAMACGLATIQVIEDEGLVERSARMGELLRQKLDALTGRFSFIKEVRGRGLILAIEFKEPKELRKKMAWRVLHQVDKGLFAQMIVTGLMSRHRILTQVAGHNMDVVKILPPLVIGEKEVNYFVAALDSVLQDCGRFPGPMWDLGKNFVSQAVKARRMR